MQSGFAVVVDIGKTLSKLTLWSREGEILERFTRPNERIVEEGVARLDESGIAGFVLDSLAKVSDHPVEFIVPVAHGAGAVAIKDGSITHPPFDYEAEPPEEIVSAYRQIRAPFAETGSPALPAGLNLGMQLYWADSKFPEQTKGATLVPWTQYWAWLLSGVAASEVTSLGCHTDLWDPVSGDFSSLAKQRGWADRFAPLRKANDVLGTLRPELAAKTGLSPDVKILAGLHDSNAALLAARGFAEIEDNEATILSTGTWFIAMRLARSAVDLADLPESRDCLANVDPFGQLVPSARFMGGREIESLIQIDTRRVDIKPDQPKLLEAVADVFTQQAFVLPTLSAGNGPYPDLAGGWVRRPEDWYARRAGACLYAALVANTALDLVGAQERLLVEGRFSEAEVFVRALASLRPGTKVYVANAHNDVSFGAMRLIDPSLRPSGELRQVQPLDEDISLYAAAWHAQLEVPA
ncbi:FGGY-family carbohydrate kinase [Aurantiacibacter marinus]|uniref:Carbohydrate kinase n=1 Tax=Aurantiacibacter marinus TaxID=874156 RepID=A0A0H0XUZ9_9SPHN|nr:FGGY family carbohydrate kinase [Aurantiacibacter marinus]KLI64130.1 carbohydrate kinase [Aurantiacibacter marinus]